MTKSRTYSFKWPRPYTYTGLSYLRWFLATSSEYSYALFTPALIERSSVQAGNRLPACLVQTRAGTGNKLSYNKMYRAEVVARESTSRVLLTTLKVDILALYIFLRNSRFLIVHENMYTSKITFMIA